GWSGLGARAAKAAVAELKLVPAGEGELIFPDDLDALNAVKPASGAVLVSSLDNLFAMRRELDSLLDAKDLKRIPRGGGRGGGTLMDLPSHAVLADGKIAGLWEFDAARGEIACALFVQRTPRIAKAIERAQAFVRDDLGDARSFSLDSPESRAPRVQALRKL